MRPPLDVYDVLIHLSPKQVPLLSQAVDPPAINFSRGAISGTVSPAGGALPVIDYDPVALYLAELRVSLDCLRCGKRGEKCVSALPELTPWLAFRTPSETWRSSSVIHTVER